MIENILSTDIAWRLGWTLLHSVWQILGIGILVGFALGMLSRASANVRYWIACGGLASMFVPLVATFVSIPSRPHDEPAAAEIPSAELRPVASVHSPAPPVESSEGLPIAEARAEQFADSGFTPTIAEASAQNDTPAVDYAAVLAPSLPWVVGFWLAGVGLLAVWNVGGWFAVQRLRSRATVAAAETVRRRLDELARRMKVSRPVMLAESLLADVPLVIGWLRPVILLPVSLATGLPASQLDAILAHELGHIRRHDYLVNLLQSVAESVLFYHPAVWLLSRRIRIEREFCCDDAAIAACGDRSEYVSALAAVESSRGLPAHAMTLLRGRGGLTLHRVRRILGLPGEAPHAWVAGSCAVLMLVVLGFGVAFSWSEAGDEAADVRPATTYEWAAAMTGSFERGVIVERLAAGRKWCLDLDTGKSFAVPERFQKTAEQWQEQLWKPSLEVNWGQTYVAFQKWIRERGIDVVAAPQPMAGLSGLGMIAVGAEESAWRMGRYRLSAALAASDQEVKATRRIAGGKVKLPTTHLFRTREGGIGVMQVLGTAEKPAGVKICFRVFSDPTGKSKAGGWSKPHGGMRGRLAVAQSVVPETEQIVVDLELRNENPRGALPLAVQTGRPLLFEARVTDAEGRTIAPTGQKTNIVASAKWTTIAAGAATPLAIPVSLLGGDLVADSQLDATARSWKLPPGRYRIEGTFTAPGPGASGAKRESSSVWNGRLELPAVEITVDDAISRLVERINAEGGGIGDYDGPPTSVPADASGKDVVDKALNWFHKLAWMRELIERGGDKEALNQFDDMIKKPRYEILRVQQVELVDHLQSKSKGWGAIVGSNNGWEIVLMYPGVDSGPTGTKWWIPLSFDVDDDSREDEGAEDERNLETWTADSDLVVIGKIVSRPAADFGETGDIFYNCGVEIQDVFRGDAGLKGMTVQASIKHNAIASTTDDVGVAKGVTAILFLKSSGRKPGTGFVTPDDGTGMQRVTAKRVQAIKQFAAAIGEWGEAVEGVQVRIRASRLSWDSKESPKIILDIRKSSDDVVTWTPQGTGVWCDVECDGTWYTQSWIQGGLLSANSESEIEVKVVHDSMVGWMTTDQQTTLKLTQGPHTIRVAFKLGKGRPRAISGPLTLVIAPR